MGFISGMDGSFLSILRVPRYTLQDKINRRSSELNLDISHSVWQHSNERIDENVQVVIRFLWYVNFFKY
jgi:hypothetical protein